MTNGRGIKYEFLKMVDILHISLLVGIIQWKENIN